MSCKYVNLSDFFELYTLFKFSIKVLYNKLELYQSLTCVAILAAERSRVFAAGRNIFAAVEMELDASERISDFGLMLQLESGERRAVSTAATAEQHSMATSWKG